MPHLYFNKDSDYSEENTCEKSFAPPQKKTKHIHASFADLLHTVLQQEISIGATARNSHCRGSAKKGVLEDFAKLRGNSRARGNTCEFCKVSKKTIFTERLRITASEMQTLQ